MRTDRLTRGTLLSAMWCPKWEGNPKKGIYVYIQLIYHTVQQKLNTAL